MERDPFRSSLSRGVPSTYSILVLLRLSDMQIFMTFFGAVAFGDFEYHPWNVAGLAISLVGSCIYAYDKVTSQLSSKNSSKSSDASASEPKDNKKDFPVIQKGKGGSEV